MYNLPSSQANKRTVFPQTEWSHSAGRLIKVHLRGYSLGYSFRTCHLNFNLARQYSSIITADITSSKVESGHRQLLYLEISIKVLLVVVKTEIFIHYSASVKGLQCRSVLLCNLFMQVETNFSRLHTVKSISQLLSILLLLLHTILRKHRATN